MSRTLRGLLLIAVLALSSGCQTTGAPAAKPPPPAYSFILGVGLDDVLGMLGRPNGGLKFDRYSQLTEAAYLFPDKRVQVETAYQGGNRREELVDRIYMFFDKERKLVAMGAKVNAYYPSFIETPVHRAIVFPAPPAAMVPPN